ncbi:hypothetical protein IFM89_021742 [Coptis chinensis]|uniref:Carbamoyl phosphate synthase small chain, chloroplastic n=1 Tax=Coptis chinensis TaxID=261450 RepID=A0A835HAC1_9MAGN|nr:hypothetical protein IFM89_021742 [Coptis chinensis]
MERGKTRENESATHRTPSRGVTDEEESEKQESEFEKLYGKGSLKRLIQRRMVRIHNDLLNHREEEEDLNLTDGITHDGNIHGTRATTRERGKWSKNPRGAAIKNTNIKSGILGSDKKSDTAKSNHVETEQQVASRSIEIQNNNSSDGCKTQDDTIKAKTVMALKLGTQINLGRDFSSNWLSQNKTSQRFSIVKCSIPLASNGTYATPVERPWKVADARLVLEDGSIWKAKSFGASGTQVGEVVFNTSLTGYQEIITDPSYAGQFVLMTYPHIGNTGVNFDDEESKKCFLAGLVVRSLSISTSNWRCTESLGDYLEKRNIMGIYDVDTRAITRRLRQDGSLIGVLSTEKSKTDDELLEMSRTWNIVGVDLISGVSCAAPYKWVDKTGSEWEFLNKGSEDGNFHVVAYDFGIKHNILRRLASCGCKITVVPCTWPASETLKMKPDGVLFSNGPGDPSAVPYAVKIVKEMLGKVPVFGICMGHQLLGQALGGKTFKMKFGHHGGNHPVRNLRNSCVEISAQNHNYAVDPASLPEGVEVTHVNLNDGSCAGLAFPALNIMSLQYHPEASPGPHDSDSVFTEFTDLMKQAKSIR